MKRFFLLCLFVFFSTPLLAEELVGITALDGKVSLLAPAGFQPMPQEKLEFKYPASRRPTEVLSNESGSVTLAFRHADTRLNPAQVREAHTAISRMFHNLYPSAEWIRDEVIAQNGDTFMVMELTTPAIDTTIHNIIYGASVDGRLLLIAFNVDVRQAKTWLSVGRRIMASIALKKTP